MIKTGKLKAGALQFTLFITVVIALLLATFIILIHTHKRFRIQSDFVKETVDIAQYGMDYALKNNIQQKDTLSIDFKAEDYKTFKVYSDYWGVFEKVVSTSRIKHNEFSKIALVGASQPKLDRTALYVEDNNKPLVVVGNTKVQGTAYLPKQGVRTGNISGHSYYGNQLIYGTSKTSNPTLPKLRQETLEHIKGINKVTSSLSNDQYLNIAVSRTHRNSFYNPLQIVYSNSSINLSDISLTGHILVQSRTKIIVEASSELNDVVLIAPEIEIKSYTKGTFQAFATEQITIGNNCELNYPSALVLNEDSKVINALENVSNNKVPLIKINKSSKIWGVVAYLGNTTNYKPQIFINEKALVIGEVYCTRNLELLGSIYGSLFTSNFIANQSGSSYQNHLYNGQILIDELPHEYVGLSFRDSKKNIAKWLY